MTPETGYARPHASQAKRARGLPPPNRAGNVMVDHDGNRIVSGSEWTDEDAF
jgi:protein regulator of cytokinesis 1